MVVKMEKNTVGIYLPPKIMKLLDELSDKTGMSRSSVVRVAVLEYARSLSLLTRLVHYESQTPREA
jgi:metal-responsive CopG/Arc/MetJ family transcriptional regulator